MLQEECGMRNVNVAGRVESEPHVEGRVESEPHVEGRVRSESL